MQDIRRASIRELAHKIKGYGTPRFAFFLGAGASKQSGIPVAGEMIRHFKKEITAQCCPPELETDDEKTRWLVEQDWYKADGSEYCKCFEKLEPKEIGRQRYIESIIEKREPSFGYVVLANLMAGNHINTIITTNFDDLVYSACTTFTGIRPIVYAYGVLASEMRLTALRPKILKLHGDYLYSALKNTGNELDSQEPNMARQLRQVLSEYGLIVVGYSGGDKSIMDILSDISERNDLYWCIRRGEKINSEVEKLLTDKGGFLIEIDGFDEMMNEVRRIVEFDVKKMLGSIEERRNQIIKHLQKFDSQYSADILGEIVEAAKEPTKKARADKKINALDFVLRGDKAYEEKGFSKAEELYRKAIEIDPNYVAAYNNLGVTLRDLKRHEEAEKAYRKAIELDPNYALAYINLGVMLRDLKRPDEAEAVHRKAIELDPDDAAAYNNLGVTLRDLKRYDEAVEAYRKAIELDPDDADAHSNLIVLLRVLNRETEAIGIAESTQDLDFHSPVFLLTLAALYKKLGNKTVFEQYAAKARGSLEPNDWYNLACLESLLENTDAAIDNLTRASQVTGFSHEWARRDPDFEWIRDDPRFKEIVGEASE